MRFLAASIAMVAWLAAAWAAPLPMTFHAVNEGPAGPVNGLVEGDARALQEMLGGNGGPQRWKQPPELTVLVSVMAYRPGGDVDYVATDETLTDREADELVRDLTDGLALLTADAFQQFSSVTRVAVPAGTTARVSRTDQIVAGRFDGLRRSEKTLGFGGRRARKDGTITSGAILLDREFDSTSTKRRLLRTHELGHALGFNHVRSRASVMNPSLGTEPNDFDRQAALIAFHPPATLVSR